MIQVGKRINKKRYLYPLPEESHGRVTRESMVFTLFGLLTRRASHDGCRGILTFLNPSNNHYFNSAEHTFLLITTNGQASADTDKRRDPVREQTRFQLVSTQNIYRTLEFLDAAVICISLMFSNKANKICCLVDNEYPSDKILVKPFQVVLTVYLNFLATLSGFRPAVCTPPNTCVCCCVLTLSSSVTGGWSCLSHSCMTTTKPSPWRRWTSWTKPVKRR